MQDYRLGEMEQRFAQLIWANEPIASGDLVKLCQKELDWKKSTTYTVLRRLCEKGLFQNENGIVRARLNSEEYASAQSEAFVDHAFSGSLPKFLAAFTAHRKLSQREIDDLQRLIDDSRREAP